MWGSGSAPLNMAQAASGPQSPCLGLKVTSEYPPHQFRHDGFKIISGILEKEGFGQTGGLWEERGGGSVLGLQSPYLSRRWGCRQGQQCSCCWRRRGACHCWRFCAPHNQRGPFPRIEPVLCWGKEEHGDRRDGSGWVMAGNTWRRTGAIYLGCTLQCPGRSPEFWCPGHILAKFNQNFWGGAESSVFKNPPGDSNVWPRLRPRLYTDNNNLQSNPMLPPNSQLFTPTF